MERSWMTGAKHQWRSCRVPCYSGRTMAHTEGEAVVSHFTVGGPWLTQRGELSCPILQWEDHGSQTILYEEL